MGFHCDILFDGLRVWIVLLPVVGRAAVLRGYHQAAPSVGGVLRRRQGREKEHGNDKQAHCLCTLNHFLPFRGTLLVLTLFRYGDLTASIVCLESSVFAGCVCGLGHLRGNLLNR